MGHFSAFFDYLTQGNYTSFVVSLQVVSKKGRSLSLFVYQTAFSTPDCAGPPINGRGAFGPASANRH
jgi:hypothetical protein